MLYDKRWEKKETLQEWQKILLKAAALIRRDGWCRGAFQDSIGALCAYGAINVAAGLEARKKKFQPVPVIEAIQHLERNLSTSIINWNDQLAMDKDEIIRTLRWAAKSKDKTRPAGIRAVEKLLNTRESAGAL